MAFNRITSLSTAQSIAAPTTRVAGIRLQPETQDVRIRMDGTAPTATVGWRLTAGQIYEFVGDLGQLQVIEVAASASLNWAYFT